MKRQKEHSITDVLNIFLREEGLETPLNEYRLVSSWGEIVGKRVEKLTDNIFIKNQVLFVEVKSPAMRSELIMQRTSLVKRLNDHVGFQVISDITFL